MPETSYKAKDINDLQLIRDKYDLNWLAKQISKRGDETKLAKHLGIERITLHIAINEAKILSMFPNIKKSMVGLLSILKTNKEKIIFSEKNDIQKLTFKKLYYLIKEWRILLEKNPKILLTEEQQDLIIGSTLGDANIRQRNKNCSFRVGHSKKQEKYLYLKYNLLKEFTKLRPSWTKRNLNNHLIETLDFSTFTHSIFNFYYNLFYKNGKKRVTREILDMLTPRSLTYWICDDGSFETKQGYIILCTNAYSLEEHKIIKQYFEEVWNLSPTIGFRDKKYYYLRFKQEDTKKLIKIIKPFIPNSMTYKIGEKNE